MAHSKLPGLHFRRPIYGDGRAMGGLLDGFPIDIAARIDVVTWFNDFLRGEADYDNTADWTQNYIGGSTGTPNAYITTDTVAGQLFLDAGTADGEGIQTEFTGANGAGEFIVPAVDKWYAFGARFKISVAAKSAIFVGLNETLLTTDLMVAATGALTNVTNCIGFWKNMGTAALTLNAKRSVGSASGSAAITTMANDTFVDVGFRVEVATPTSDTLNGRIVPYLKSSNGSWQQVGTPITGSIPSSVNPICPAFAVVNEAGDDSDLSVDYFWIAAER